MNKPEVIIVDKNGNVHTLKQFGEKSRFKGKQKEFIIATILINSLLLEIKK